MAGTKFGTGKTGEYIFTTASSNTYANMLQRLAKLGAGKSFKMKTEAAPVGKLGLSVKIPKRAEKLRTKVFDSLPAGVTVKEVALGARRRKLAAGGPHLKVFKKAPSGTTGIIGDKNMIGGGKVVAANVTSQKRLFAGPIAADEQEIINLVEQGRSPARRQRSSVVGAHMDLGPTLDYDKYL